MLNKVILTGNLGRDPHVYLTKEGKEVVTFSLATKQSWKTESGEWYSVTDWHNITVFREPTIRWIKDVLKRGHKVYVEGKLTYQHWTDKFGQKRMTPHVVITSREGRVEEIRPAAHSLSLSSNLKSTNSNSEPNFEPHSENRDVSSPPDHEDEDVPFEFSEEHMNPKN